VSDVITFTRNCTKLHW